MSDWYMEMKRLLLFLFLITTVSVVWASDYDYKFRLLLKDKGTDIYSIDRPDEFLSKKALDRRKKQNIAVDSLDIPISQEYIRVLEKNGGMVVTKSRWLNTVSVQCPDSSMVDQLKELPFVKDAKFVWKGKKEIPITRNPVDSNAQPVVNTLLIGESGPYEDYYGWASKNIKLQNGHILHEKGYKGAGVDIAILDAGYNNLKRISLLDNINIVDFKSFVYKDTSVFMTPSQHGLNVLSCMATNKPYEFVGTAPEANYILLRSEDSRSEFPIEEDYWVAAIEYADSIGVDVVNSSLGYNRFDAPAVSFEHSDLNGKNALITRGADMAVRKGMFVVCSAGNSGNSEWRKITPPADGNLVLTVGAVQRDSVIAGFSSRGFTADLRIKPDIVALGSMSGVIDDRGQEALKSGTSFSSPIMCGLVACLWQAFPMLTNKELLRVIRESSNKYESPDDSYGYGIPDMQKAMQLAQQLSDAKLKKQK